MIETEMETIIRNKKARHDFSIIESVEAGIVLQGTEIKSIRQGKANLADSFARIENGEVFLYNFHISPYRQGNIYNHNPLRAKKLLLHRSQIKRLIGKVQQRGFTLVPLRVYFKNGRAKVELAVAKGKRSYDKRQDIAKREAQREMERELKK
ncbi:MAG: SsrA-binding protein [Candidatus Latescibacterota bacterium]|nr:MAG: SsrA-binding protein [Candidatus Latescibacterota bacterium]